MPASLGLYLTSILALLGTNSHVPIFVEFYKSPLKASSHVNLHLLGFAKLLKKDFEESIASVFIKKNGTSGTNEFLPKMSSNRCCVFIARIDLAKIMKLMLRVSSESKYSFFNRKVIEHIVEKMDVVV